MLTWVEEWSSVGLGRRAELQHSEELELSRLGPKVKPSQPELKVKSKIGQAQTGRVEDRVVIALIKDKGELAWVKCQTELVLYKY